MNRKKLICVVICLEILAVNAFLPSSGQLLRTQDRYETHAYQLQQIGTQVRNGTIPTEVAKAMVDAHNRDMHCIPEPAVWDWIAEKAQGDICQRYFGAVLDTPEKEDMYKQTHYLEFANAWGKYLPEGLLAQMVLDGYTGDDPVSELCTGSDGLMETLWLAEFNVEAFKAQKWYVDAILFFNLLVSMVCLVVIVKESLHE